MNPSTAQARVVVDELIRGGVRDVVLCPGSRNAPLAFALHDADRAGRIRLHVRIDERTAGYLAIGLAVAERAPVCVAMTSGTAVANLGSGGGGGQLRAGAADRAEGQPALRTAGHRRQPDDGAARLLRHAGARQHQPRVWPRTRRSGWMRSTRSGDRRPAEFWWPPRDLAPPTPARCSSTSRCASRWCPTPTRPDPYAPEGRPDGRPWTYTPPVTFDQPLDIDLTPDTVVIAGHGAGVHPNLATLPTVAEPTAPPAAEPTAPVRAAAAAPAAGDHAGPPDAAPAGVGAAGRPVGAGVRADHRATLARRVGKLAGHGHPCGDHRRAERRTGSSAAPR